MKTFFKKLFCRHGILKFKRNVYGDEINLKDCRSLWECEICGIEIRKNELNEPPKK